MVVGEDFSKDDAFAQQASRYWYVAHLQSEQKGEGIETPAQDSDKRKRFAHSQPRTAGAEYFIDQRYDSQNRDQKCRDSGSQFQPVHSPFDNCAYQMFLTGRFV